MTLSFKIFTQTTKISVRIGETIGKKCKSTRENVGISRNEDKIESCIQSIWFPGYEQSEFKVEPCKWSITQ